MEKINDSKFYILNNNEIAQIAGGSNCHATSNVTYRKTQYGEEKDVNADFNCDL